MRTLLRIIVVLAVNPIYDLISSTLYAVRTPLNYQATSRKREAEKEKEVREGEESIFSREPLVPWVFQHHMFSLSQSCRHFSQSALEDLSLAHLPHHFASAFQLAS